MCGQHMEQAYKALKVTSSNGQEGDAEGGSYFCHASGDKLVAGCSSFSYALGSVETGGSLQPAGSPIQIDDKALHSAWCYNIGSEHVLLPGPDPAAQATLLRRGGGAASHVELPNAESRCYAFSPDGRWLMVGDPSGQVQLVSTSSSEAGAAQPLLPLPPGSSEWNVTCCCFSPSGQLAAAGERCRAARRQAALRIAIVGG
jgi:hypothetical protein